MRYLDYRTAQGRLANQFYFALQAYLESKKEETQYLVDLDFFQKNGLLPKMQLFGLDKYVKTDTVFANNDIIVKNQPTSQWWKAWHQLFFVDFTLEQLEEFIHSTFILTGLFKKNDDDIIGLHIRLGDYCQSSISNCFDKIQYIEKSLGYFNMTKVKCFSDDIKLAKKLLTSIENKNSISIEFSSNSTDIEDFIELSCLKNKILWNSTFSYWTAFISNILYPNSYQNICCPALFSSDEPICDHNNPLWNNIQS